MGIGKLDNKLNRLIIINFIITIIILTFVNFGNNTNISPTELQNKYWLPSTVMQSVAAIYAVFIAIFILTIQRHQIKISSVANVLKPQFERVSYIIITVLWFNGLILSCFSYIDFEESKVNILLILSSISLFISLFAIVNFSFKILSSKVGLITPEEFLNLINKDEDKLKSYLKTEKKEGIYLSTINLIDDDTKKFNLYMNSDSYKKIELKESYIGIFDTHENPFIRARIAKLFGNIKIQQAVELLIEKLKDHYEIVRQYSAEALGEINDRRAVEHLILVLNSDSNADVRKSAAEALGKIKDIRAVDPLIQSLKTDNYFGVRQSSANALGKINDLKAVLPLIESLKDNNFGVRWSAAQVLGNSNDVRAVKPLIQALKTDNYVVVRGSAAESIGNILDIDVIDPNIRTLNSELILDVVESLIDVMSNDEDVTVRTNATEALIKINHIRTVDLIIRSLNDNNLIMYSAISLGKLKDIRAIKPLIKKLNDNDYDYAESIYAYTYPSEFLKKANKMIKSKLVYALGELRDESAVEPLIRSLNDKDGNVVINSAIALGKIKNTGATKPLINKLNKNNFDFAKSDLEDYSEKYGISILDCRILFVQKIRSQIAEALGEIGDEMAFIPLMKIINNNKEDDDVRRAAGMAICKIKGEDWFRRLLAERSDINDLMTRKEAEE